MTTTWWVDLTYNTGAGPHPAEVCTRMERRLGGDSAVGNSPEGELSISLYLDAVTLHDAITEAGKVVERAIRGEGYTPSLVAVDACTETEFERRMDQPTYPELVSGPEAARILGINRQRLHQLTQRPDFPDPLHRLGSGSLWLRTAIETFAAHWERKPGRPKVS